MKIRGTTINTPLARHAVPDDTIVSRKPWSSKNTVDKLCPAFTESGAVVTCEPVEGYPLVVTASADVTKIMRTGKNIIPFPYCEGSTGNRGGMTYTVLDGGGVLISGNPTAQSNFYFYGYENYTNCGFLKSGEYTFSLSGDYTAVGNPFVYVYSTSKGILGGINIAISNSVSFTVTEDLQDVAIYTVFALNNYCTGTINPQLEVGSTMTAYEPYQGGEFAIGEEITAIAGANTLWADFGEIIVTGRCLPSGGAGGGESGEDGFSPVVSVSAIDGGNRISITDANSTKTVDVMDGKDGAPGADGKDGNGIKSAVLNADYTLTLTFDDGTSYTTPSIRGATGPAGSDGKDGSNGSAGADGVGISSIKQTTTSSADGGSNVFTVTLTNGTTATFTVKNGSKGSTGANGASVTVKSVSESTADGGSNVVTFSDGKTLTVKNGKTGAKGADGHTPVKGVDYFTEADKAEFVAAVMDAIGCPVFGLVDENNNIVLTGKIPDGTYSIKYDMENGSTVDIGDLELDTNVYYSVSNTLTNCTSSNSAKRVVEGESYSATISAKSGYELKSVTATMGGSAVSVTNGVINIASVTGNIVITAVAEEIKASYTNLADPTSADWWNDSRLGSDGSQRTGVTGCVVTNYIELNAGDVVRVQGMNLTTRNSGVYGSNKVLQSVSALSAVTHYLENVTVTTTGGQMTAKEACFVRFVGDLTGTASDIIITVNEEIE